MKKYAALHIPTGLYLASNIDTRIVIRIPTIMYLTKLTEFCYISASWYNKWLLKYRLRFTIKNFPIYMEFTSDRFCGQMEIETSLNEFEIIEVP